MYTYITLLLPGHITVIFFSHSLLQLVKCVVCVFDRPFPLEIDMADSAQP